MCWLMFTQGNSDWWKTEPQTPTLPKDEADNEEEEEDYEDEVEELDSLFRLHNELADAGSSHE